MLTLYIIKVKIMDAVSSGSVGYNKYFYDFEVHLIKSILLSAEAAFSLLSYKTLLVVASMPFYYIMSRILVFIAEGTGLISSVIRSVWDVIQKAIYYVKKIASVVSFGSVHVGSSSLSHDSDLDALVSLYTDSHHWVETYKGWFKGFILVLCRLFLSGGCNGVVYISRVDLIGVVVNATLSEYEMSCSADSESKEFQFFFYGVAFLCYFLSRYAFLLYLICVFYEPAKSFLVSLYYLFHGIIEFFKYYIYKLFVRKKKKRKSLV